MNIACPYCRAVIKIQSPKTGRFTPQCPKCHNPFVVVVPEDETGTVKVEPLRKKPAAPAPDAGRAAEERSDTDRLPIASARPTGGDAPSSAETAIISRGSTAVRMPPPRTPAPPPPTTAAPDEGEPGGKPGAAP